MIATVIAAGLAILGILWIALLLWMWVTWHRMTWPGTPTCQCGKWALDTDSGVTLPLVDGDLLHDHRLCMPVVEYIHHPEDPA